jgi:hypothetical protein
MVCAPTKQEGARAIPKSVSHIHAVPIKIQTIKHEKFIYKKSLLSPDFKAGGLMDNF